ncbi:uncharacterized protein IL334_001559 [Kwoniella shivajii]|uniref:Ribonuclease H1 N-terminal domain-containing protein n=1 Tax=Kwoniella shivajii TaxID=564305 RepID=A0ABZ1CVC5_9TREE|nr:hypothetical protein IL334_001559 [Kwoniella shivajii]
MASAMITSFPSSPPEPSFPGAYTFSSTSTAISSKYVDEQPLSYIPENIKTDIDPQVNQENTSFEQSYFSISTPLPTLPLVQSVASSTVSTSSYRVSRLPPAPTVPHAGPSRGPQRYLYFAVRKGHTAGVYTAWYEAEAQIINHPEPVYKTFSTKLAAQAFVNGWDGAGRHSLPASTPRPLREHLAMSFPGSVNISTSPAKRQSYHSRLLVTPNDFSPSPLDTTRPPMNPRHSYHRHSMVKISSPLRCQLDEEEEMMDEVGSRKPPIRKASSFIGIGGLLSPPQSPEKQGKNLSVMDRERPNKSKGNLDGATWSSRGHRDFTPSNGGLGLTARPLSPPQSPNDKRTSNHGTPPPRPSPSRTPSGLWADTVTMTTPAQSSPLSPGSDQPEFTDPTAPKFSRSGLRKSGVVMPVAAKRTGSSNSLRTKASSGSLMGGGLGSNNSSSSSINSWSDRNMRRSSSFAQDRLSSLAENSKRELQLNEEGLLALSSLSPPKPAFMMRRSPSASSVASNESDSSMASMTSGSSAQTCSLESCEPILEEDNVEILGQERDIISCTKSDGDADGSVGDRDSVKGNMGKKGKGGMFKRLAKALKLEKKSDRDSLRRGSM